MKKVLLLIVLTVLFFSCVQQNATNQKVEAQEIIKYPDSFILKEQTKFIGDINYGMDEKTVKKLLEKFDKETSEDDKVMGSPFKSNYIGNFNYFRINDYYYHGKLYKIEIDGRVILRENYSAEIGGIIKSIEDIVSVKYGAADYKRDILDVPLMNEGNSYLIEYWNIGAKKIEIWIADNGSYYTPTLSIYIQGIEMRVKTEEEKLNDSISNARIQKDKNTL